MCVRVAAGAEAVTAPPGGPWFEKKPGACSEEMLISRGTPSCTQASTTLKVAPMLLVKTCQVATLSFRRQCTHMHHHKSMTAAAN